MSFLSIELYMIESGLPDLVIFSSPEGGHWCKRSDVGFSKLSDRTIVGIPILGNSSRDYYVWAVVAKLTTAQTTIFEELKRLQRDRYSNKLANPEVFLRDKYNYVSQSEATRNSREIIEGSTVATGVGSLTKSFCQYPVFLEIGEDHLTYEGGLWWPIEFSMQELP